MVNKSQMDNYDAKIEEQKEINALKAMQEESVRKFKAEFPNGAIMVEGEFLE